MADTHDAALREYLIGVLEAAGPEAAERRLALRDAWRHTRRTGIASSAPTPSVTPAATDRDAEWSQLTELWDRSLNLSAMDRTVLTALMNSTWPDVQQAANQLEAAHRQRTAIAARWPNELGQVPRDLFLQILSRPATRCHALRQRFREEFHGSYDAIRAFRRFAGRFRREFPELLKHDPGLLADLMQRDRPMAAVRSAPKQAEPRANRSNFWTAAIIILGGAAGIIQGILERKDRPSRSNVRYQSAPAIDRPETIQDLSERGRELLKKTQAVLRSRQETEREHADKALREMLQKYREEEEAIESSHPSGDLEERARLATQILTGIDLAPFPNDEDHPADALQPANHSLSGSAP